MSEIVLSRVAEFIEWGRFADRQSRRPRRGKAEKSDTGKPNPTSLASGPVATCKPSPASDTLQWSYPSISADHLGSFEGVPTIAQERLL